MNHTIYGDCRETMRNLIADGVRVQYCVTSPPYYGLRDYGQPGQLGREETPAEHVAAMAAPGRTAGRLDDLESAMKLGKETILNALGVIDARAPAITRRGP